MVGEDSEETRSSRRKHGPEASVGPGISTDSVMALGHQALALSELPKLCFLVCFLHWVTMLFKCIINSFALARRQENGGSNLPEFMSSKDRHGPQPCSCARKELFLLALKIALHACLPPYPTGSPEPTLGK